MSGVKAEQIQALMYVAGGVIAAVVAIVYTFCQRRKQGKGAEAETPRRRVLDPGLCAYVKKNGEQCQHEPKRGSRYCALHARKELMRRIESAPRQQVYEIDPNDL